MAEIDKSRMVKTPEEIALLRESARRSSMALKKLFKDLRIGMTEIEVADLLHKRLEEEGLFPMTWGTIVAAGANAADPHAKPGDRVIQDGDMVVLDFGAQYEGWCSDITRTYFFGEVSKERKEIFRLVQESHDKAIYSLMEAKTTKEVEDAHRSVFLDCGLEQFALRSLGHGLGKEIHEAPFLRITENDPLLPGMVFTIEPGLYLPGDCGVRIEDDVLVTEDGYEVLTDVPVVGQVTRRK